MKNKLDKELNPHISPAFTKENLSVFLGDPELLEMLKIGLYQFESF